MANKGGKNKKSKKNRGRKGNPANVTSATAGRTPDQAAEKPASSTKDSKAKVKAAKPQKSKKAGIGSPSRRNFVKLGLFVAGGGAVAASLHAYDRRKTLAHDLSAIGSGTPVLVQIHDPGCPTCRRLKGAVSEAMGDLDGVHSRIADITTPDGRTFAAKYGVPKTTLLFFDAKGKHRHTMSGIQTPVQVQQAVRRYLLPGVS